LLTQPVENLSLLYSVPDRLTSGGYFVGKLEDRSAQILQTLYEDILIDVQIILSPHQASVMKRQKRRFGQTQDLVSFSVILYGPKLIAEDVGRFCQDCEIYLQEPRNCDRDVPYCNPHCLSSVDGEHRMTSELHRHSLDTVVTEVHQTDILQALLTPRWVGELSTPSTLRTNLFPYAASSLYTLLFAHLF
jgi:SWI/SNF-related matrix-associated actin-dependent regulator of chromatin subfamily A3